MAVQSLPSAKDCSHDCVPGSMPRSASPAATVAMVVGALGPPPIHSTSMPSSA
jgi:hypothetical protein